MFQYQNRFVCESNARVGKVQATVKRYKNRIREIYFSLFFSWPQRHITCFQSPLLAPTSKPLQGLASLSTGPVGHTEYEWLCNWQTKLCIDTTGTGLEPSFSGCKCESPVCKSKVWLFTDKIALRLPEFLQIPQNYVPNVPSAGKQNPHGIFFYCAWATKPIWTHLH